MATVRVRRDDYEDGVLPKVCVRSGAPADVLVGHRSSRGLGWWGLLLVVFLGPVGLVAWAIADRLVQREAEGQLPASRAAVAASAAARRRWDAAVQGGLALVGVGVVLALLTDGTWRTVGLLLASVGIVVAGIAWFAPAALQPKGTPDRDGRWIELAGVSPEFARAYRAQDEARAAARRSAAHRGEVGPAGSPLGSPAG